MNKTYVILNAISGVIIAAGAVIRGRDIIKRRERDVESGMIYLLNMVYDYDEQLGRDIVDSMSKTETYIQVSVLKPKKFNAYQILKNELKKLEAGEGTNVTENGVITITR